MILFHSGDLGDSTSFWPLTHFGTQEAAMHRARNRYIDCLKRNQPAPIAYMYECEVDLSSCRTVAADSDWGTPSGIGLIRELYRLNLLPNPEEQMDATQHLLLARRNASLERELCSEFLKHLNIGAVSYTNEVEDRGVISYCVIDPALITIRKREGLSLCP